MKIKTLLALGVFGIHSLACASLAPARTKSANPTVTVVQSIPEETNLAVPGLPYAEATWVAMIGRAKKTIDVAQMYVSNKSGEGIERVLKALTQAANRGVKIRFMLSKNMIDSDPAALALVKAIPGIQIAILDLKTLTGGILHAKYWIIDGEESFIGSQNFDWKALSQIHETGVLVQDSEFAKKLGRIFAFDWELAMTGKLPAKTPVTPENTGDIDLVASPALMNPSGVDEALPKLLKLINDAKTSIHITLLDYSTSIYGGGTWLELDNALRAAATRGVKVQLLVSHWNTGASEVDSIKNLSLVPNIEVKICFIPQHSSGFISYARVLHSKTMIVDDSIYWVSTSNWSKGYFYTVRNVDVIIRRPDFAKTGMSLFNALWNASYTEYVDAKKKYPEPKKGY